MPHPRATGVAVVMVAAVAAGLAVTAVISPSQASNRWPRRTTTTAIPTTTAPTLPAADLVPPSNLRVTGLTPTSVTFQWDHAQGYTGGCTFAFFQYDVYRDGTYQGSTLWGSPVAASSGLQPGRAYSFAVQARDNCSGRYTDFSEPLLVTTPV